MEARKQRWPSSWAFELRTREAGFPARVTNISESGLRFEGQVKARPGQLVKFKLMNEIVTGRIVRLSLNDGAIMFREQLSADKVNAMRQLREFHEL